MKDLRIPKAGLTNTIKLDIGEFMEGYCVANRRLKLLADVFFFRSIPPSVLYEMHTLFHQVTREEAIFFSTIFFLEGIIPRERSNYQLWRSCR